MTFDPLSGVLGMTTVFAMAYTPQAERCGVVGMMPQYGSHSDFGFNELHTESTSPGFDHAGFAWQLFDMEAEFKHGIR